MFTISFQVYSSLIAAPSLTLLTDWECCFSLGKKRSCQVLFGAGSLYKGLAELCKLYRRGNPFPQSISRPTPLMSQLAQVNSFPPSLMCVWCKFGKPSLPAVTAACFETRPSAMFNVNVWFGLIICALFHWYSALYIYISRSIYRDL